MKKKHIIIGIGMLAIVISIIIIIDYKNNKKEIQPLNNNIIEQAKKVEEEVKELEKQKQKETYKKECIIDNPLLSKNREDGFPIHDSTGPITEEKIKEIIDQQLSFLIYKNNYQEITNENLFNQALMDKNIYENKTFTKEDINNSLEKTVLSNLKLRHESHYSNTGYNYIYENGIYTIDDSNYVHVDAYDEQPIYGETQKYEEENGIIKIEIKYLWIAGNYEPSTTLYRNRYDAAKKINKIQIPSSNKCYLKWIKENFSKYKDDLPTYTYAFKEVNNHIYLVDYYITNNK